MLNESQAHQADPAEMKTPSDLRADLRAEEQVKKEKRPEFREYRTHIYDSYVYIHEVPKSDEVFLFQTKMEL